eukprot:jgi/Tetstr1/444611/TSEL_032460.t2
MLPGRVRAEAQPILQTHAEEYRCGGSRALPALLDYYRRQTVAEPDGSPLAVPAQLGDGGGGSSAPLVLGLAALFAALPYIFKRLGAWIAAIPQGMLTPFLMAFASLMAAVITVWNQREQSAKQKAEEAEQSAIRRREAEMLDRRRLFQRYAEPIGRAAGGLQRKLFLMHEGSMPDRGEDGVAYTAYQLGNFLGLLQIVYGLSPSMSFGHPGRDCIRRNLLQSVEDAFAWDVEDLHKVATQQGRDAAWRNAQGECLDSDCGGPSPPLPLDAKADLLHISRSEQRSLGELMLRSRWGGLKTPYGHISDVIDRSSGTASNEMISFSDFKGLLQSNSTFSEQWAPILRDIRSIMPIHRGTKGKNDSQGASSKALRVPVLQTALLDLLDFMDPKPFCRIVSINDRQSIMPRISSQAHPGFLRYLATINQVDRVKGRYGPSTDSSAEPGPSKTSWLPQRARQWQVMLLRFRANFHDRPLFQVNDDSDRTPQIMVRMGASGDAEVDPFSHRVIATLEEQGIPYSVVPVCLDPKPCWFYSITRNATVPTMFHEGTVVDTSELILDYVAFMWPSRAKLTKSIKQPQIATDFFIDTIRLVRGGGKSAEDRDKVLEGLRKAQAAVQQRKTKYFGGSRLGDTDLKLVPALHQTFVILESSLGMDVQEFSSLREYCAMCMKNHSLRSTGLSESALVKRLSEVFPSTQPKQVQDTARD